ncbi:MAG: hypothetical protein K0R28_3212, partial [Paenibacillus sp.]|nr:hypothetical protein [Paenibacillus sp.]
MVRKKLYVFQLNNTSGLFRRFYLYVFQ